MIYNRSTGAPPPATFELWSFAEGAPPTRPATTLIARGSVQLNAGQTYTLTWFGAANYGNLDESVSRGATVSVEVEGVSPTWTGATRPGTPGAAVLPSNPTTNYTDYDLYSLTFTAQTSGTAIIRYTFNTDAYSGGADENADNVALTLPSLTCS